MCNSIRAGIYTVQTADQFNEWTLQTGTMVAIDILKYPTSSPADTTPLNSLKADGYDALDILAVIGKTEGQ
jgi:hypothetical protein